MTPLQHDTLACDSVRLAYWQAKPDYDYNAALKVPEFNLFAWIKSVLNELMYELFGSRIVNDYGDVILITILVVIVLLLLWFVYKKNPGLFMFSGKQKTLPYAVTEDSIYGVDFPAEIADALQRKDYREAVRLQYLYTLKDFDDCKAISWQPHKTPTQYIYELKPESLRAEFRQMTTLFLRVRYGNFDADNTTYEELTALRRSVLKGGAS